MNEKNQAVSSNLDMDLGKLAIIPKPVLINKAILEGFPLTKPPCKGGIPNRRKLVDMKFAQMDSVVVSQTSPGTWRIIPGLVSG